MAGARRLLYLWLGCFCVSLARGERLKQNFPELHKAVPGDRVAGGGSGPVLPPHDKVSEHMLRLYDRYRGGGKAEAERTPGSSERGSQPLRPQPLREGNTVRSFRAGAAGECPRRPVSAVQPQVSPGTPPPPSSSALRSLMLPGDLLSPCAVAPEPPRSRVLPGVMPVLEPELRGRSGEKGAEQLTRSGGTAWKGGRGYPHAQRSPPALGVWSTQRYLRLMILKPASGNSLGLGFSHVYLKTDVILCQPRGTREKSHTFLAF